MLLMQECCPVPFRAREGLGVLIPWLVTRICSREMSKLHPLPAHLFISPLDLAFVLHRVWQREWQSSNGVLLAAENCLCGDGGCGVCILMASGLAGMQPTLLICQPETCSNFYIVVIKMP